MNFKHLARCFDRSIFVSQVYEASAGSKMLLSKICSCMNTHWENANSLFSQTYNHNWYPLPHPMCTVTRREPAETLFVATVQSTQPTQNTVYPNVLCIKRARKCRLICPNCSIIFQLIFLLKRFLVKCTSLYFPYF